MANCLYLVASGDLRSSANQMCWPAQNAMEEALKTSVRQFGWEICRAHPFQPNRHGFIDSQRYGMNVFQLDTTGCPAGRRRSGVAIQPSFARRLDFSSRPDSNRRQLEWYMAGPCGLAESERISDQGGSQVQHSLERGVY